MLKVHNHNNIVYVFEKFNVNESVRLFTDNIHYNKLKIEKFYLCELENKIIQVVYDIFKKKACIDYSWLVNLKPGESGVLHNHPTYPLVTVYYSSVYENSGNLIFKSLNYEVIPKNDMLVLFPGNLYHNIEQNKSSRERISIGSHIKFMEKKNV